MVANRYSVVRVPKPLAVTFVTNAGSAASAANHMPTTL
jgi:hypothetical protein